MLTKFASLENVEVLELKGSSAQTRHASLGKMADFQEYRTGDGFLYARIRAISSRVNKNNDAWPSVELAGGQDIFDRHTSSEGGFTITADKNRDYGFSTFLGKPIFVDHHNSDPKRARGVIVDAKFHVDDHRTASSDPYYSSNDVDPSHLPPSWVELLLEIDAKSFPKFAKAVVEGGRDPKKGIDGWSMGCNVGFSECNICHKRASTPDEYCKHIRMKGAHFDHIDPKTGHRTSKKAYENCHQVQFFEISGVFDPADETALSREIRSSVDKTANSVLDEIAYLRQGLPPVEQHRIDDMLRHQGMNQTITYLRDAKGVSAPVPSVAPASNGSAMDYMSKTKTSESHQDLDWACPECGYSRFMLGSEFNHGNPGDTTRYCADCGRPDHSTAMPNNYGGDGAYAQAEFDPYDATHEIATRLLGPKHQGSVKTADNPAPQYEMSHAPEKVDTLREEHICGVCGSSMDGDTCQVCGYQDPPEGFGNPDLTKAKDTDVPKADPDDSRIDAPGLDPNDTSKAGPEASGVPSNPTSLSHVSQDMSWDVHTKTAARINKTERPLLTTTAPQTNEPQEKIIQDQLQPVTSSIRTAADFIAATGQTRRNTMNHTAEAASGVPADAKPDVRTDVLGIGGVDDASNDAASKADAQVDVTGVGTTGVSDVSADEEGVNVEQGDEHSKNVESIPTKTWGPSKGDSLHQQKPTTSQTPWWQDNGSGFRGSSWNVDSHDDGVFPAGEEELDGGKAVTGVKPIAEQFGERVNVKDHVTSPANNSGPTKTWTGTEGNGVLKQQDPVTNESIALGESGMTNSPNWTSSTHIFSAFKLAEMEVELGLLSEDQKYQRAAELEHETPAVVEASLKYAQRVKKAARKTAGVAKLPVMGRSTSMEKEASVTDVVTEDDSFMFGGL